MAYSGEEPTTLQQQKDNTPSQSSKEDHTDHRRGGDHTNRLMGFMVAEPLLSLPYPAHGLWVMHLPVRR